MLLRFKELSEIESCVGFQCCCVYGLVSGGVFGFSVVVYGFLSEGVFSFSDTCLVSFQEESCLVSVLCV